MIGVQQATHALKACEWPQQETWSLQQVEDHLKKNPFLLHHENHCATSFILYKKTADLVEIDYLMTFPQFRRRGFMGQLLSYLIRSHPQSRIWLEVHAENWSARHLYKKFGFENRGLRRKYYRDGGDSLLLERPVGLEISS